jgi:transposase InsO family protein
MQAARNAWLKRPRSQRSRSDEELGAKVRASFIGSDRTYGARRVWRDLLAEGMRRREVRLHCDRGIWAVDWMCGALGVSRGGF